MKEAIGTSYVFNLIMIFVGIMIALLVGSIAYSKGFKVRNRVIDLLEKHEGFNEKAQLEIDENLKAIGYRIVDKPCEDYSGTPAMENNSSYRYCIYEFDTSKGNYYGVKVYIHFDIPIIGDFIEIPLYGESRIIFDKDKVNG